MTPSHGREGPRLGGRLFLTGAAAGGVVLGLAGVTAAPASAATAFGYTSSGGYYTVRTGAGLTFKISQSTGGMSSLNLGGTELQPSGTNESHVESGIPSPP